jgi:hypothetical protein
MGDWAYLCVAGTLNELIPKDHWPKRVAVLTMNNGTGLFARGTYRKMAGAKRHRRCY